MADPQSPLTHHGRQRGKERAGLDGKALQRTAAMALAQGLKATETTGKLRRYLDDMSIHHKTTPRIHGTHIYCFGSKDVLITVLELPHAHRGAAASALRKRL